MQQMDKSIQLGYKFTSTRRQSGHTMLHKASVLCLSVRLSVKKGKVFPYSLPSVGPGADPGVQAGSPQVT